MLHIFNMILRVFSLDLVELDFNREVVANSQSLREKTREIVVLFVLFKMYSELA